MRDVSRDDLIKKLEEIKDELNNVALHMDSRTKNETRMELFDMINDIGDILYWV